MSHTLTLVVLSLLTGRLAEVDTRLKTPFLVVPLWSGEMISYLSGETQPACSGPEAPKCERINSGVCDGTAYFTGERLTPAALKAAPARMPAKQTDSAKPQYFALEIPRAGSTGTLFTVSSSQLDQLELVFHCRFSGNDACPGGRFQTGAVRHVEVRPIDGTEGIDLTQVTTIRPDGPIIVPIDQTVKQSLASKSGDVYQVRVVAECFSVVPTAQQWTFPLYDSPSPSAGSAGALVARVVPGEELEMSYRSPAGDEVKFEPDMFQPDWGYTFMLDQTVLARQGDWFQLPTRPFPHPVWIQLPDAQPSEWLHEGHVYTLSKTIRARRTGGSATGVFTAGSKIVVERIRQGALEIRQEEPFDMPCTSEEVVAAKPRKVPTYQADAPAFYDGDLHLRLQPAYPKGC